MLYQNIFFCSIFFLKGQVQRRKRKKRSQNFKRVILSLQLNVLERHDLIYILENKFYIKRKKREKFKYRHKYQFDPPLAKRLPRTVSFQENSKCL